MFWSVVLEGDDEPIRPKTSSFFVLIVWNSEILHVMLILLRADLACIKYTIQGFVHWPVL